MGTTFLGDIPSGALDGKNITYASIATDGAGTLLAAIGQDIFRAPQDITIVSAWQNPTGADQPAAAAASYRQYDLVDCGSSGTGTRVLGSATTTASLASNITRALTLISSPTVARGNIVGASLGATVGGTHAGTVVRAGHISFNYRPI